MLRAHGYAVAVGRSKREREGIIRTRYIQYVKSGKPRGRVTDRKKPLISQPVLSTARDPSKFEKSLATLKEKPATKPCKRTRTGRYIIQRNPPPEAMLNSSSDSSSSSYHDPSEDELAARELQRLHESGGEAPPLWTKEQDL